MFALVDAVRKPQYWASKEANGMTGQYVARHVSLAFYLG